MSAFRFNITRERLIKQTERNICLIEKKIEEIDFLICEVDRELSKKIEESHDYSDPEINTLRESKMILVKKRERLSKKKEKTEVFLRERKK